MFQRPSLGKGPASAGSFRVALALGLVVAMAGAGACKRGEPRGDQGVGDSLDDRLGAAPAIIDPASTTTVPGDPGTSSTTIPGGGSGGRTSTTRAGGGGGGGGGGTTIPPVPFRELAASTDRTGDAGLEAPPYDDFVKATVEENGSHVRFTVEFAADVPPVLADGEVMGVGVDVYRGAGESEYQVFADGGSDGWRAFLQVGKKYVKYEGAFELGGNRLVFTVPWSIVGGRQGGAVAAFADWSQEGFILNKAGQDKIPDRTTTPFTPS